jgi:putative ABC transport system permease protein
LPFAPAYAFAEMSLAREITGDAADKHTFVMVGAAPGVDPVDLRKRLQAALPDTRVMTRKEYLAEILNYLLTATQIGFSFGTSTIMGLLVGLITVALSMFSSVVDNMRQFGTLKAIGSTMGDLARLLFVQAMVYGLVGSLIGLGMMAGLAGFLYVGYYGAAEPAAGTGYELSVIAAAVIGGAVSHFAASLISAWSALRAQMPRTSSSPSARRRWTFSPCPNGNCGPSAVRTSR